MNPEVSPNEIISEKMQTQKEAYVRNSETLIRNLTDGEEGGLSSKLGEPISFFTNVQLKEGVNRIINLEPGSLLDIPPREKLDLSENDPGPREEIILFLIDNATSKETMMKYLRGVTNCLINKEGSERETNTRFKEILNKENTHLLTRAKEKYEELAQKGL